jgi:hypothetical protein
LQEYLQGMPEKSQNSNLRNADAKLMPFNTEHLKSWN